MSNKKSGKKQDMWSFGVIGPERMGGLADGLLAIAMTILVLELSLDFHVLEAISDGHYSDISAEIYGYMLGFLVLGVYWVFHQYIFHFIKRSDGVLSWLHIAFLMFAALVPLSTKVNTLYPTTYSSIFYFVTTVISIMLLFVIWQYATRDFRLVEKDIDKRNISFVNNIILISTGIFTVALFGQFFLPVLGYLGFVSLIYVIMATAAGDYNPFAKL
jgi:uncharacterized membrane protein